MFREKIIKLKVFNADNSKKELECLKKEYAKIEQELREFKENEINDCQCIQHLNNEFKAKEKELVELKKELAELKAVKHEWREFKKITNK